MRLIAINAARYDAHKHRALSVVGDALAGIEELGQALERLEGPRSMDFQITIPICRMEHHGGTAFGSNN